MTDDVRTKLVAILADKAKLETYEAAALEQLKATAATQPATPAAPEPARGKGKKKATKHG